MRKIFFLIISFILLTTFLVACQTNESKKLLLDGEITKVNISSSNGFGTINSDFFAVFDDEENLDAFKEILSNAVEEEGIVDMIVPEFDIEVIYENGRKQGFHLWIGESSQRSSLMKVDDTHTIYTIASEMTKRLREFVQ